MRNKFDEQLLLLNNNLTKMGALCEDAISLVTRALVSEDDFARNKISPLESEIDEMEKNIESLCMKLLLQQQPVARDLRLISAALKMITDMERIGDQASDIAEIIPYLNGRRGSEGKVVKEMAEASIKMVVESVEAFVNRDITLAENVVKYDDIVDEYFEKIKDRLVRMIAENHEDGEYAINLLMIAKYLERIGDHATNIAEWVIFSITGAHKEE